MMLFGEFWLMNGVGGHVNIGCFKARNVFNEWKLWWEAREGKRKQKVFNDSILLGPVVQSHLSWVWLASMAWNWTRRDQTGLI